MPFHPDPPPILKNCPCESCGRGFSAPETADSFPGDVKLDRASGKFLCNACWSSRPIPDGPAR